MNTARLITCFALSIALLVGPGMATAAERSMDFTPDTATSASASSESPAKTKATRRKRRTKRKRRRAKRKIAKHERRAKKIARSLNRGVELGTIDTAFEAGSLTWEEAKALYAEQALVRLAFIAHRGHEDGNLARVRFMRDTARTSLVRLRHNLAQRIYVDQDLDASVTRRALAQAEE